MSPHTPSSPRLLALVLLLGSCGGTESSTESSTGAPTGAPTAPERSRTREVRVLRDVLGSTLARLGVVARKGEVSAAELRADTGLLPGEIEQEAAEAKAEAEAAAPTTETPSPELDPDLVELREGLIGMVQGSPRQTAVAQKDIAHLKDEIVPVMVAGFAVEGRAPEELRILIDLATASPAGEIAAEIARVAATHEEPWLRRYAAWTLGSLATTEGADQVIPLLVRRLKYERDDEALVWVCSTLAAFDNYAGTQRLYDTTSRPAGDAAGDAARTQLGVVLQRAGDALALEETPDTVATLEAWRMGKLGRARAAASDPLLAELWLLVADLSGEHFQLRGVDDARYTLSHLGPWAAEELSLALEDDDEYVRLHTTQVLERMGPRGLLAFDSLRAALADPHGAVCGAAAEALVAVTRGTARAQEARAALLERIEPPCPYEIKVACIRALGDMDLDQVPIEALTELFRTSPLSDLRLAAAPGLLRAEAKDEVLPWLIDELEAKVGDPAGAEAVLGDWLESGEADTVEAGTVQAGSVQAGSVQADSVQAGLLAAWQS
ncbi:MAG: hypothetical protein ACI80K_000861, partial [Paracoccaceae bacterium]